MKTLKESLLSNIENVLSAGDHRFLEQLRSYLFDETSCLVAHKMRTYNKRVNKPMKNTSQPGWNAFIEMARKNLYTVDIKTIENKNKIKSMSSYVVVRYEHPFENDNIYAISKMTFITKDRHNCRMYETDMSNNKPTLVDVRDNLINTELYLIDLHNRSSKSKIEIFDLSTNTSWYLLIPYLTM